ncbi:MAG TPA: trypsin-like peptidase domain-containing protein [Streptosporangiaceae bacterium]
MSMAQDPATAGSASASTEAGSGCAAPGYPAQPGNATAAYGGPGFATGAGSGPAGPEYPGQQYPGQPYPGQQYPGAQYPSAGYPGAQYPGSQYPGAGYPGAGYGAQYPGAGYPGGPQGPAGGPGSGFGGGPSGWLRRHRLKMIGLTAAAALVAGAGTAWAATSGPSALTQAQIVAKTDPAVVDVVSTLGFQNGQAAGTGIVLTPNGEVLTNNHVIDGATSIKVRDVGNGKVYTATVQGYDSSHDVALIKLNGASHLPVADLGNSSEVSIGDHVVAIGNAGGQNGTPSVAAGKITGLNESITASDESSGSAERLHGLIQTNAPIQPGDSGGPLVSKQGEIVGIDTAASSSAGNQLRAATTTQAFTVPINTAMSVVRQIESGTASATVHIGATAFLGVGISPSAAGAQVVQILPGQPAAQAGLREGDVITSVAGHRVSAAEQVQQALSGHKPGDRISIGWTDQSGQNHTATVTLGTGPAQ